MNTIGPVEIASHKYYDPAEKKCFMLPNEIMGFRPGERIQEDVKLELLEAATAKSYRKSAAAVTDGSVSYGTVKNIVHDRRAPELAPPEKKRKVKELFVFLDEAHVHMQPACPGAVRRCQQVPLATIAEGRQSVCKGRYTLTGCTQLVDARFTSESLLRKTEAFIHLFYDLDVLEKVYVYGDGAAWICQALDDSGFNVEHVHDCYHRFKMITYLHNKFPRSKVRTRIQEALESNDWTKFDKMIKGLRKLAEGDKERTRALDRFETYFTQHWDGLVASVRKDIPKSCTEPMVYHALAVRFTTNPSGWSATGLGNLAEWRLLARNGGQIRECRAGQPAPGTVPAGTYTAYLKACMEPDGSTAHDWSIFNPLPPVFDGNSGTMHALRNLGRHETMLA